MWRSERFSSKTDLTSWAKDLFNLGRRSVISLCAVGTNTNDVRQSYICEHLEINIDIAVRIYFDFFDDFFKLFIRHSIKV